jgi:hypothetical protein
MQGFGYAERLDLTVAPWKITIGELQWGRFLSATDSLVWIRTGGAQRTTIAVHNGQDVRLSHIEPESVRLESGPALELDCGRTLRTGRLSDTVLPAAPVLERFFPRSILNLRETKWCSHATLTTKDRTSTGWAIHEVVEWPV